MRTYTQISSGSYQPREFAQLKQQLLQLDIQVTEPPLYHRSLSPWQLYSSELFFYRSIAKSAFHIVHNALPLSDVTARQTLYAMYKRRPILMIGRLRYSESLQPRLRQLIELRSQKFQSANLLKLEFAELSFLLNKLKLDIDYRFSDEEERFILSGIREHLFELIGQGIGEANTHF